MSIFGGSGERDGKGGSGTGVSPQDLEKAVSVVRKLVEVLEKEEPADVMLGLQLMFARECVLCGLPAERASEMLSKNAPRLMAFWQRARESPEALS